MTATQTRYELPKIEHGFDLTEDQRMIHDMIRDFADAEVAPLAHEIDENHALGLITIFGGKLTDCLNVGDEVADAAERLRNEPDTPVLNISLDVGYRTLSSFNRAFRDIQNTTPTEFRQQCSGADIR